ncbi:MAG: TetR/AcrR family transcriptional regulator [Actinomycetota bacterium]
MTNHSVRERLTTAAFALFDERGYEHSTVDDIAERAGVGRTTFFRAFPSKDDVILPDHEIVLGAVKSRLAASTQETSLVAVSEAARLVLLHYLREGDLARSRYKLTSSVPALRHREAVSMHQYQRVFREFIHDWMGGGQETGLRAELMATSVVTAHNYVLRRWLRALTEHPEAEFDAAMAQVIGLFADAGPSASTQGEPSLLIVRTTRQLDSVIPALRKILG